MKKLAFLPFLILVVASCGQSDALDSTPSLADSTAGLDIGALSSTEQLSPEELLGKTPEEYAAQNQQKATEEQASTKDETPKEPVIKNGFLQVEWESLIAPGYDADSILKKYEPQIAKIEHGSEEAFDLYDKMQAEFDNAPANPKLESQKISIPGFIAPLEQQNGIITEFLLVPYFGACIHLPPPPSNQTVYVQAAGDYGIKLEDSWNPIWVSGEIKVDGKATDIGSAGYQIQQAVISPYTL